MRARGLALAAAVLAVAGCKTSTKSGDRVAASATGRTEENVQVEPDRASGQSRREVAENQAKEQAPSTRPTEGLGGKDPHPLTTGKAGDERYGGDVAAPSPSPQGRVPETRTGSGSSVATGEQAGQTQGGAQASGSMQQGGAQAQGSVQQDGTASSGGTSAGGTASGGAGASPGQPNEVTGRIALVDKQAHELAIDSGTSTTQVKVAPDAKISIDGKSSSFDDLRQGAEVRATLDRSSGETQATQISVTHSKSQQK